MSIRNLMQFMILFMLFLSCGSHVRKELLPDLSDGKYDSEFPYQSSSEELKNILESVKFLNSICFYKNYVYDQRFQVTKDDIKKRGVESFSLSNSYYNKTASGTATLLQLTDNSIVLLTCAHIITFPDTIYTYFLGEDNEQSPFLKSVAIKQAQKDYIVGLPSRGKVETIYKNDQLDIALMGMHYQPPLKKKLLPFKYPFGKGKELDWGTFVYVIGFPKGYKMVTRGIVSEPNRDKFGTFLTDASFNHGFSGGIILALRDGVPNFELVGVATSVSAENSFVLTPGKISNYDPSIPFEGEIYVRDVKNINYGISYAVSIEAIQEYIKKDKKSILEKGFDLSGIFWEKEKKKK